MKGAAIFIALICVFTQHVSSLDLLDFLAMKMGEFADTIKHIFLPVHLPNPTNYRVTTLRPTEFLLYTRGVIRNLKRTVFGLVEETHRNKSGGKDGDRTALLTTAELAAFHGRKLETHTVVTADGYLLSLHRIVRSSKNESESANQTVILHHGLLGSSADWLLLGPEKSLPYILADAGYEVWLANARGNLYSRRHISKPAYAENFWNFSWQEMGRLDLPAVIDHVNKKKKDSTLINFIGHSMGATAILTLLSTKPLYNKFIRIAILLAPIAFTSNVKGPLRLLAPLSMKPPNILWRIMGHAEYVPSGKMPLWLADNYCEGSRDFCRNPLFFLTGVSNDIAFQNPNFKMSVLAHVPSGGSTSTILHYAQCIRTGLFQEYGQNGKEFQLDLVSAPIALFSSDNDSLSTLPDVQKLFNKLKNPILHHHIKNRNLTHTDFAWGNEAIKSIYDKVVEILSTGNLSTCNNLVFC